MLTSAHRTRRIARLLTAAVLLAGPLVHVGTAGAAAGTGDPVSVATTVAGSADGPQAVTLVTGDRVVVADASDGRHAVSVEPARRDGVVPAFEAIDDGGQLYVIPSDAAPLVGGVLDRELFNVTKLAEYGAAGHDGGLPVIVSYDSAGAAGRAERSTASGMTVTAALTSIDAVTATIDGPGWWRSVSRVPTSAPGTATDSLPGVERVWLDELVEVALDQSVPMIGAPTAWEAGYDGTGVTVAVLDTGIDADHPDLAGKVVGEQNFSDAADPDDRHGHGTHVAGILTGSGAASDGRYRGVAPGVELLNGKVLSDFGFGLDSWIITGMEWAAGQGADVVNMSLGGGPSDGTDPLSQAVNALTAEHGTLFVIAAGNLGELGEASVASPGAADAALTVGSVTKAGQLAGTSSRGPRLGDYAIKPDVTAPGVDITSARADGTGLGPPVGERYTRISGTSMAAPHVAGAAAILRQARPELDAGQLKAALSTTAVPADELDVYRQGGGRIDLPSALDAPVLATGSPVDFGYFAYPHGDAEPARTDVTFTSQSDRPVTLDLSLAVTSSTGVPADDGLLSVQPGSVTVQPGGSARATLTVDVTAGEVGRYGGYLVATSAGEVVSRVPVGFYKEEEHYDLTIEGIARDGSPARWDSNVDVVNVDGAHAFAVYSVPFVDGVAKVRVQPGTYSLTGLLHTYPSEQVVHETAFVADPEVEVRGPTTAVLDATGANPIEVATPAHDDIDPLRMTVGYLRRGAEDSANSNVISKLYLSPEWTEKFATPTDPVTIGEFEFFSHWRLGEPVVALDVVRPAAELDLLPLPMHGSPPVDGSVELPLVHAGFGAPGDYAGLDAQGAIVLVRRGGPSFPQKAVNAAAAGAAAMIVANDRTGQFPGYSAGEATIPAMTLSQEHGDALLALLAGGDVTLRLRGNRNTDQLYELVYPEPGAVPAELGYVADLDGLARLDNAVHSDVPDFVLADTRGVFRPWMQFSVVFVNELVAPQRRIEYLVPNDTRYRQDVRPGAGVLWETLTTYQAGERRKQSWLARPGRPGVREGSTLEQGRPAYRDGDRLRLELAEWIDAGGHWGDLDGSVDTSAFRLYQDGELIASTARPRGDFTLSAEPAEYRLELDIRRDAEWWTTSTATRTAWTVRSRRPPGPDAENVPLLLVDYGVELDLANTAEPSRPGSPPAVDLRVRHQAGAGGPAIGGVRTWVSYDDGTTWRARPVRAVGGGRYQVVLPTRPPGGAEHVSLRVEAWDTGGNRIEQEITRAWRLPQAAAPG